MVECATAVVKTNDRLADGIFRLRIRMPTIARTILPGQFVMVRACGRLDPLLARPLALYDTIDGPDGSPDALDLVYVEMGAGTRALARLRANDQVELWGPLGNTFPRAGEVDFRHLMILAGGIGQTPFVAVLKDLLGLRRYGVSTGSPKALPKTVTFCWGVRTSTALAALDDFRIPGVDVHVATEDGSAGFHGNVIDLAEAHLPNGAPPTALFACGPEPMLEAVSHFAARHSIPAWVSIETKMACGYGVCFSCVCAVKDETPTGWDYRRVCLEGPVFRAATIEWKA